jgi:hypothetical protein
VREFGESAQSPVQLVGADRNLFADRRGLEVNRELADQAGR